MNLMILVSSFFVPDPSDPDAVLQPENLDLPPISTAPEVLEDEVRRSTRSTFSVPPERYGFDAFTA